MAAAQLDRGMSLATDDTSVEPFTAPPSVQGGNVDPSGRKMMKLRAKKVQQELRAGFAKLPAPKFAFDVAPSAPVVGTKTSGKDEVETDKGELEEEAKRLAEPARGGEAGEAKRIAKTAIATTGRRRSGPARGHEGRGRR